RLFECREVAEGVVVVDRRERIFAAERQEVPIVAADAFAGNDRLHAILPANAAAAFMPGPGGVDAATLARLELALHEPHRGPDAFDLAAQEVDVAGPDEVIVAGADEVEVVGVVSGVD